MSVGIRHHYGEEDGLIGESPSPVTSHGMDPAAMKAMFAKQAAAIGTKGKLGVPSVAKSGAVKPSKPAEHAKVTGVPKAKTPSLKAPVLKPSKAPHAKKHAEPHGPATGRLLSNVGKAAGHVVKAAVTATGQGQTTEAVEEAARGKH